MPLFSTRENFPDKDNNVTIHHGRSTLEQLYNTTQVKVVDFDNNNNSYESTKESVDDNSLIGGVQCLDVFTHMQSCPVCAQLYELYFNKKTSLEPFADTVTNTPEKQRSNISFMVISWIVLGAAIVALLVFVFLKMTYKSTNSSRNIFTDSSNQFSTLL